MDSRFDPFKFHITEEQLDQTPSRLDGVDVSTEYRQRIFGCELIQHAGIMLKLHQGNMATGQVLFHRFFYRKSMRKHAVEIAAMACLFLACKVAENPRKSRDVIQVFHRLKQRRLDQSLDPLDTNKPEFFDIKTELVRTERAILKELSFLVHLEHPYKYVLNYLKVLDLESNKEVTQRAWNYINDSFRTNVCILYNPEVIATACIYLACRHLGLSLPEAPSPWWELFDTSLIQILKISLAVEELYRQPKADSSEVPEEEATNGLVLIEDGPATKKQKTVSAAPPVDEHIELPDDARKSRSRSRSRSRSASPRSRSSTRDIGGSRSTRTDERRPRDKEPGDFRRDRESGREPGRGKDRDGRDAGRDKDRGDKDRGDKDRKDRDGKAKGRDTRDDRSSKKDDKDTRPDSRQESRSESRRDRDRESDDETKGKIKKKSRDVEAIKAKLKVLEEEEKRKKEEEKRKDLERYERAEREREAAASRDDDRKRKRPEAAADDTQSKQARSSFTQSPGSGSLSQQSPASLPPSPPPPPPPPPDESPLTFSLEHSPAAVGLDANGVESGSPVSAAVRPPSPPSDPAAAAAFIVASAVSMSVLPMPLSEPAVLPQGPAPRMLRLKRSPHRSSFSTAAGSGALAPPTTPPRRRGRSKSPVGADASHASSRSSPTRSTSPAFRPASGASPTGDVASLSTEQRRPSSTTSIAAPGSPQPVRRGRSPVHSLGRARSRSPTRGRSPPSRTGRSSPSRKSPPSHARSPPSRPRSPSRSLSGSRPSSAPNRSGAASRDSYTPSSTSSSRDRERERDRRNIGSGRR
eukprot:TRINITY_DN1870_c0_g1_i3.p1 TRINITY_DN1870_c0_g1~~TRINITY_DN1870_c0_g1_i3.p1  ORF type:complete len:808 (+),score=76.45 TRINITY_DN1870_c0_g1_i3:178-2601(+)